MNTPSRCAIIAAIVLLSIAGGVNATVFPTTPWSNYNFHPFGYGTVAQPAVVNQTIHQVFHDTLFIPYAPVREPVRITSISLAGYPGGGTYNGDVTVRLGYTYRAPGALTADGGLFPPTAGGGGAPNANSPMSTFFSDQTYTVTINSPQNFGDIVFDGSFDFHPALGHLLVEIVTSSTVAGNMNLITQATGYNTQSTLAHTSNLNGASGGSVLDINQALKMDFEFTTVPEPASLALLALGGLPLLRRRRR